MTSLFLQKCLLAEIKDECLPRIFELTNIRALSFDICKSIDALTERIKESTISYTYGTNNK